MWMHVAAVDPLLLLCSIPLYEYTAVYPSVVDGHLGSFQVWAFMNNAAMPIIAGLWGCMHVKFFYLCIKLFSKVVRSPSVVYDNDATCDNDST